MPVLSEPVTDGSVLGAMSPCCWWHPSFASLESVTLCMGHLLTTTMSFDLISPVTYLLQRLSFTPTVSSLHSLFTSCWASSPSERIAKTMGGVGSSQHQQTEPWNIPSWKRPIPQSTTDHTKSNPMSKTSVQTLLELRWFDAKTTALRRLFKALTTHWCRTFS